jgi:O-antigen ligase
MRRSRGATAIRRWSDLVRWLGALLFFGLVCPGEWYALRLPLKPAFLLAGAGVAALRLASAGRMRTAARALLAPPLGCFALFLLTALAALSRSAHPRPGFAFMALYVSALLVALAAAGESPAVILGVYRHAVGLNLLLSVSAHLPGLVPGFIRVDGVLRFGGLYAYPSPLAAAAAAYLLMFLQHRWERMAKGDAPQAPAYARALGWLELAAASWVLWQARSRGVLMVLFAVSVGFLVAHGVFRLFRHPAEPVPAWPLFTAALSLVLLAETQMTRGPAGLASMSGRVPAWEHALSAIAARPFLGYGPGSFRDVFQPEQGVGWHSFGSHNAILDACLYSGVFGGLFYTCFLGGVVLGTAARFARQPARAGVPFILTAFWVLLAMTDPFLMRWPYSSHVVLLVMAAWVSSPDDRPHLDGGTAVDRRAGRCW